MNRTLMITAILAAGAAALVFAALILTGPTMDLQPHLLSYQTLGGIPPAFSVPVEESRQESGVLAPEPDRKPSVESGHVFYGYYCLACHGTTGDGNGPVGESFLPRPSDLRAPAYSALSDSELAVRMLGGVGHSVVRSGSRQAILVTIVPHSQVPDLAAYVRRLCVSP